MASGEMALGTADTQPRLAAADSVLVEQCRRGDAQAFARLVTLHESMVYNLAVRLLGDPEEARDVSQEVFLQVYRRLGRFEGRSNLKTWIYRIVVNQSHNRRRFWRRRRRDQALALEEMTPSDEATMAEAAGRQDGPHEQLVRRERGLRMEAALAALSFEHRAILLLREVEELSCEEMADSLGLPVGTVKSRLARARESLRSVLLAQGEMGVRP